MKQTYVCDKLEKEKLPRPPFMACCVFSFWTCQKFYQFFFVSLSLLLYCCLLLPFLLPLFSHCIVNFHFVQFPHGTFMLMFFVYVWDKTKRVFFVFWKNNNKSWQQPLLKHEALSDHFSSLYVVFLWLLIWYADGYGWKMLRHA